MKKLSKSLFDLTEEQKESSISIYGKVIKCLIAPYHNILNIPLEPNNEVYVYPERDLSIQQRKEIVSVMAGSAKTEICFVTADLFIILDMIDCCCRILTPDGKIENVREKTFSANPHSIINNVLQDDKHVDKYKDNANDYRTKINAVITAVNEKKMTQAEFDKNKAFINLIGEDIIRNKLREMLSGVEIIRESFKKDKFTGVVEFSEEELKFIKNKEWFKENQTIKVCLERCREDAKNDEKRLSIYKKLITLQEGDASYKDELKENLNKKKETEIGIKLRHKLEYWLTEQKEEAKIKDLIKN